jgi:hypothetical protein
VQGEAREQRGDGDALRVEGTEHRRWIEAGLGDIAEAVDEHLFPLVGPQVLPHPRRPTEARFPVEQREEVTVVIAERRVHGDPVTERRVEPAEVQVGRLDHVPVGVEHSHPASVGR